MRDYMAGVGVGNHPYDCLVRLCALVSAYSLTATLGLLLSRIPVRNLCHISDREHLGRRPPPKALAYAFAPERASAADVAA